MLTCIVGVRTPSGSLVKGFDVRIDGRDVHVNYSDSSTPEAHASYHESGQYHMKREKRYIEWDGGLTGGMEPMKLFRTPPHLVTGRGHFWTVGWHVATLDQILPPLEGTADMLLDARGIRGDLILGFETSVVGCQARERSEIVGYGIIASHQFGETVRVEIEAFVVNDEEEGPPDGQGDPSCH